MYSTKKTIHVCDFTEELLSLRPNLFMHTAGLRTESFNQRNVSLSNNVFAVIEHNDKKGTLLEILICFFDHIRRLMFKMRSEGRCYGICFFSYVM